MKKIAFREPMVESCIKGGLLRMYLSYVVVFEEFSTAQEASAVTTVSWWMGGDKEHATRLRAILVVLKINEGKRNPSSLDGRFIEKGEDEES